MNAEHFTELNTLISVKEPTLLSKTDLDKIMSAEDEESLHLLLQNTEYHFSLNDLSDTLTIEKRLMNELIHDFHFAYEESPVKEIVDIFALKFMYHNLKMLLIMRATGQDLSHLLTPIGRYSMNELRHVVQTLESAIIEQAIVDEIASTWNSYVTYNVVEALDIGMDNAYFKHLRLTEQKIDHPDITNLVNVLIDFYNVISAKRGLDDRLAMSDLIEIMSDEGTYTAREFIELVENHQINQWFDQINQLPFDRKFDKFRDKMLDGSIQSYELEKLQSIYTHSFLHEKRREILGPMPVLRYLYGKQMEIKNLRLILTGRVNQLSNEQITERMRPIYGETI
ncbi:V-type ATPase subunit [Fundicoccus ignavus]|uniref:V-type ATP synthase subunit C n=1 Tax=Fundicoccus ignavus TaxID=2664442 RepID=A0A844CA13_9LACT|nr:V-type ATPase subunit [Fundicoccus ignavus]MRJ47976.1 V-type ATP synthase subunit C [Fundicoccus ignavus]